MKSMLPLFIATALQISAFNATAHDEMQEHSDLVVAGGNPVTLLGPQVALGQQAPDFKVVDNGFKPVQLSDFKGQQVLISIVPSLDTGVCSVQTKRFNEEVANLPEDVVMMTISTDLPFAQKRFCKAEKVDQLQVLSDAVWRDFANNYGLMIKDRGFLARAIFVIDEQGKVSYKELVKDLSHHPDYDKALAALKTNQQN